MGSSGYFGEDNSLILPCDDVPGACDLHVRFVAGAFHGAGLVDFKELWVQRPPKELKHQFGNAGTD